MYIELSPEQQFADEVHNRTVDALFLQAHPPLRIYTTTKIKHSKQTRSQFHMVYQAYKKEKNKFINKLNRLGGVSTLQPNPYN